MSEGGDGDHGMLGECREVFKNLRASDEKIIRALWGPEGTTGIIRDVGDLKHSWTMISAGIGVAASIISSIITALVISRLV